MARDHFVDAPDGLTLHAAVHGIPTSRLPAVCVPGLTRNSRDFEGVAPMLAGERVVVAADLRGRGRSGRDATGASYALDTYVDDVIRMADDLALERFALIGTSLGGLVALWLAADHADRVAAIVLNDIGPELQPEGAERIRSYAGKLPPVTGWADAVAQMRVVNEVAFPDFGDADWERAARRAYRETDDGTVELDHDLAVAQGRLSDRDAWEVFAATRDVPMLLVRGDVTDVLSPVTVSGMEALHPGLEVVGVPDRGHAPTLEEPVARAAVAHFLAAVDAGMPAHGR